MIRIPPIVLAAAPLLLSACQTTKSDNWTGGALGSFSHAEKTCEDQTARIEEEANRPEFYVACMAALGWTPNPGTTYADPAQAPDPS